MGRTTTCSYFLYLIAIIQARWIMAYSIRRFIPQEWEVYKAIRLEALQSEPGMFGNSYTTEAAYEDFIWKDRLANPRVACFGLYEDDQLIGLTSIFSETDQKDDAYMTQSFIRKAYRGHHLSRILYDARLSWAKEQGITQVIVGHRETNLVSKAANQRFGFKYSHRVARLWPDGKEEDMVYYTLLL
jgi:RimJ/RimL family protein N-acetyltransferase